MQTLLHRDSDFATCPGGSVTVDDFEQNDVFFSSQRQFACQTLEGFADLGHIVFEVYGSNGGLALGSFVSA